VGLDSNSTNFVEFQVPICDARRLSIRLPGRRSHTTASRLLRAVQRAREAAYSPTFHRPVPAIEDSSGELVRRLSMNYTKGQKTDHVTILKQVIRTTSP